MSHISFGTSARPTGNYTGSSQTSYFRNYHLLTLALLMRHTSTSVIPSLQQQNCQFHAVAETTVDHDRMPNANTSTRFLHGLFRVKQLVQLLLPCCPIFIKNEKITGLRLSMTSTSHTPVSWHRIYLTT